MVKKKIIKIFLFVIMLLVLVFIIFTTRKAIILADIDSKVSNLENTKKNIYLKMDSTTSEYTLVGIVSFFTILFTNGLVANISNPDDITNTDA